MSSTLIETLRALAAKATPGPWKHEPGNYDGVVADKHDWCGSVMDAGDWFVAQILNNLLTDDVGHANAALIVALRNALPELLALASAPVAGGTCGTCENWQAGSDEIGKRRTSMCCDEDESNPMSWQACDATFGCNRHVPASQRTSEEPQR